MSRFPPLWFTFFIVLDLFCIIGALVLQDWGIALIFGGIGMFEATLLVHLAWNARRQP